MKKKTQNVSSDVLILGNQNQLCDTAAFFILLPQGLSFGTVGGTNYTQLFKNRVGIPVDSAQRSLRYDHTLLTPPAMEFPWSAVWKRPNSHFWFFNLSSKVVDFLHVFRGGFGGHLGDIWTSNSTASWSLIPGTTWQAWMTLGCEAKTRSNGGPEDGRVGEWTCGDRPYLSETSKRACWQALRELPYWWWHD